MTNAKVIIVDASLGNIGSVASAIERIGASYKIASSPEGIDNIKNITHVILPGVGTFKAGMKSLKSSGWYNWIKENHKRVNLLGICLGMQLLAEKGYEGIEKDENPTKGLSLIQGSVVKIKREQYELRVPHVGWNNVKWEDINNKIADNIEANSDFYFVHSYEFLAAKKSDILATTDYGDKITAVIGNDKTIGVQFHPEKSQKVGNLLLKNFLNE